MHLWHLVSTPVISELLLLSLPYKWENWGSGRLIDFSRSPCERNKEWRLECRHTAFASSDLFFPYSTRVSTPMELGEGMKDQFYSVCFWSVLRTWPYSRPIWLESIHGDWRPLGISVVDGDIVCIELELLISLTAEQQSRQNGNAEQLFILLLSVGRGAHHFVESFVLSKLGYKKRNHPIVW